MNLVNTQSSICQWNKSANNTQKIKQKFLVLIAMCWLHPSNMDIGCAMFLLPLKLFLMENLPDISAFLKLKIFPCVFLRIHSLFTFVEYMWYYHLKSMLFSGPCVMIDRKQISDVLQESHNCLCMFLISHILLRVNVAGRVFLLNNAMLQRRKVCGR